MRDGILYGSLFMRKWRFRITLMLFSFSLWVNQIANIFLENYKSLVDSKNALNEKYVAIKNYVTESWLWGKTFGNSTEELPSYDPYLILYYVIVTVSFFFWIQILYALLFTVIEYRNEAEAHKKGIKKIIYIFIILINIGVYYFLTSHIFQP